MNEAVQINANDLTGEPVKVAVRNLKFFYGQSRAL